MIRIMRNSKNNKVAGVMINGKQYSVSKDLGHALAQEEESSLTENRVLGEKAKSIQNEIINKKYIGESSLFRLQVCFDEMNRIVSKNTAIEFKGNVAPFVKEQFLKLIEDFVLSVNRAHYKRHLDYSSSVKSLSFNTNKKSA